MTVSATEMLVPDVSDADKGAETTWLRANVMGPDQPVWALRITARDRYSVSAAPRPLSRRVDGLVLFAGGSLLREYVSCRLKLQGIPKCADMKMLSFESSPSQVNVDPHLAQNPRHLPGDELNFAI